jgi:hypothetical protein
MKGKLDHVIFYALKNQLLLLLSANSFEQSLKRQVSDVVTGYCNEV